MEGKNCKNCGTPLHGPYCSHCGLKWQDERLTVRHFLVQFFQHFTNIDEGFWLTIKDLFSKPEKVINTYIQGNTKKYSPPLRLMILVSSLSFFLILSTGYLEKQQTIMGANVAQEEEISEKKEVYLKTVNATIMNVIQFAPFIAIPFFGWFTSLFFKRFNYNFAEHLVINSYLYSIAIITGIFITVILLLIPSLMVYGIALSVLNGCIIYTLGLKRFLNIGIGESIVKSTILYLLSYLCFILILSIVAAITSFLYIFLFL